MAVAAALIAAVYGVAHVLGWKEYVCCVFATSGDPGSHIVMGLLYATAHLAFVLLVPCLALAAIILALLSRLFARTR
jgi:hypothetical protein